MNPYHEQLKQTTHQAHIRLEKRIVTHIKSISTPEEYSGLLNAYYAFISPLEEAIAKHVSEHDLPDIKLRMRADNISNDLRTLNATLIPAEEEVLMPRIHDLPSAVGALYVLEGSTMGGPYIAAMIQKRMNVKDALSYFYGYGDDNKEMWAKFLQLLTSEEVTRKSDRVIDAALETFEKFDHWMERYQSKSKMHESA